MTFLPQLQGQTAVFLRPGGGLAEEVADTSLGEVVRKSSHHLRRERELQQY
jgi:hypothetical protein